MAVHVTTSFDPNAHILAFIFNVWASARQDGTYANKNKEKKSKTRPKRVNYMTAVNINGKIRTIRLANGMRQLSFGGIEANTIIMSSLPIAWIVRK